MNDLIIYGSLTSPYIRLIRIADGGIVAAANWSVSQSTTWGNSDIALTKNDLIGGFPVSLSRDLPPGDYDLLVYDNATPADTDTVQKRYVIQWTGTQLMGFPIS